MSPEVPRLLFTTILASLATWLLLASIIVIPTMASLIVNSHILDGINKTWMILLSTVEEIPSLVVATTCCICGVLGLSWVCWDNKGHPAWMTECILL